MSGTPTRPRKTRFGAAPVAPPTDVSAPPPAKRSRFGAPPPVPASFQSRTTVSAPPPSVTLNVDGKMVDSFGREVKVGGPVSTLRVNMQQREDKARQKEEKKRKREQDSAARSNPYLAHTGDRLDREATVQEVDPELALRDRSNRSRRFKFIEEGSLSRRAEGLRARQVRLAKRNQNNKRRTLRLVGESTADWDDGGDEEAETTTTTPTDGGAGNKEQQQQGSVEPAWAAAVRVARELGIPLPARPSSISSGSISSSNNNNNNNNLNKKETSAVEMEWWDTAFLPKAKRAEAQGGGPAASQYDLLNVNNRTSVETPFYKLVEHPVPIASLTKEGEAKPLEIPLTKRELKQIRKRRREEQHKELQLKIQIGLIPPPPPKVKMSTLMNALGSEAVADPSRMEKHVAEQVEARMKDHDMRNLANKLTPAERRAKREEKYKEAAQGAAYVAVFRVGDLLRPEELAANRRFKIDIKARDLRLSGIMMIVKDKVPCGISAGGAGGGSGGGPSGVTGGLSLGLGLGLGGKPTDARLRGCNAVVVEGIKKSVRKFTALMLRKIDWKRTSADHHAGDSDDEDDFDEDDGQGENDADDPNSCELMWYGQVPSRTFGDEFECMEKRTGTGARAALESRGVAHYWDMCQRWDPATHDRNIEEQVLGGPR